MEQPATPGGSGAARATMIVVFLQDDYHREMVPILQRYADIRSAVNPDEPAYTTFQVISDEIRNAMDHAARAAMEVELRAVRDELEMASWHLKLGQMYALAIMCEQASILASELIYRGEAFVPATAFDRLDAANALYETVSLDVLAQMDALDRLEQEARAPNYEEIENTRGLVEWQQFILNEFARLLGDLPG